jgi:hypothetical protein
MTDRDVKEDADGREGNDQARATVRDEGERNAGERREPHDRGDVDRRLSADEHREAGRKRFAERVAAAQRNPEADVGEGGISGDERRRAD